MIRIKRPSRPPILARRGVDATRKLCGDHDAGIHAFEFDSTLYGAKSVKNALRKAQHEKCAFCESKFTHVGYGDVEHFRPKGATQQGQGERLETPGYYWLAYEWTNLLFSCQICNQRHKKNLFPLASPGRRARSHRHQTDSEEPLLIDCASEDPEAFIGFHKEIAFPVADHPRGHETIGVLGINRSALKEARLRHYKTIKFLIDLIQCYDEFEQDGLATADSRAKSAGYRAELVELARDEAEYASMTRCSLRDAV